MVFRNWWMQTCSLPIDVLLVHFWYELGALLILMQLSWIKGYWYLEIDADRSEKIKEGRGRGLRGRKEMWVSQKLVASLPQTIKVSWMCPWDETTTFHEPFNNQSENQNWSSVFHIIKHKEIEVFELWKDWSSFSSNWASFIFSSEWLLSKNVRLYFSST